MFPAWDGKFYCCPIAKLNADASSGAWKLHCYWDILSFDEIVDKIQTHAIVRVW